MTDTIGRNPKALHRRIRQHLIGRPQAFFAVTTPGLEALCRGELIALPDAPGDLALEKGGVLFQGRLTTCYQANLMCRTTTRVLMRIADFKADHFGALEKRVRAIPWELYLPNGADPEVQVSSRQSKLYHTGAVAERIRSAVRERLSAGVPSGEGKTAQDGLRLYVRLQSDRLALSLDSSGAPLYKRGLKTQGGPAPLRETLAAAVLMLAGYDRRMPLCDPMSGSGTFAIEAAMMVKQIPPGWYRTFAFMEWPAFRKPHWDYLHRQAAGMVRTTQRATIWASDRSRTAVARLADTLLQMADRLEGLASIN